MEYSTARSRRAPNPPTPRSVSVKHIFSELQDSRKVQIIASHSTLFDHSARGTAFRRRPRRVLLPATRAYFQTVLNRMIRSMPEGPKNSEIRANKRRDQIVAEAARLFEQNGYAQTNMVAIAHAANLQKPSLYHYFSSKAEVLVRIHRAHMSILWDGLAEVPRGETPPDERLRAAMRHIMSLMKTHPHSASVFFEYTRELPEDVREEIMDSRRRYRLTVVQMIKDGIEEGQFRDVDPFYTTMAIFGMCNWLYRWYGDDPGSNPDEVEDVFWDFVARSLLKR